jgi:uncharacterized membrane protein
MNIALWILQVLLALHTVMGAVWKLTNSEQSVGTLASIPHAVWMGLIGVELLCAIALLIPASRVRAAAPVAALVIAGEMVLFSVVHLASGAPANGQIVYWVVVAALCGLIAGGRLMKKADQPR